MLFKDLKIGKKFKFTYEDKIYIKNGSSTCERFLDEKYVFGDTKIIPVTDDNEVENSELILKNSAESLRIKK